MDILHSLCSVPTAPFVEGQVVEFIEAFVKARPGLRLTRDTTGNLLIERAGNKRGLPRWVFTAHMDHPGLVSGRMLDATTLECDFRGWVMPEFIRGTKVRFFPGDGREISGVALTAEAEKGQTSARRVTVRVKQAVGANVVGMFDQGEGRVKGGKFLCRCCDDLAGAAAALTMLDELLKKPANATVAVLLTRAEEDGFMGAIAACLKPALLKKSDRVIAIETSAMQPYAPQGAGPIIRVGDKTSIFNSSLTYFLTQQAEAIKKADAKFCYQRSLMPGGTCEATVYDVYGYHAASICVALGNYHNMDRARGKIGPEFIDVKDWEGMVRLFVQVARNGHTYAGNLDTLQDRLEKRFRKLERLLK